MGNACNPQCMKDKPNVPVSMCFNIRDLSDHIRTDDLARPLKGAEKVCIITCKNYDRVSKQVP